MLYKPAANYFFGEIMSKFFYKGRIEKKPKYESFGFTTKRAAKLGTSENPLNLTVQTEERKVAVVALADEHQLAVEVIVDASSEENTQALDVLLNKPTTTTFATTPKRNDPCHCGSGKKYKKCCG
ncbi:zinc chelation protein SecC [Agarivorans sp. Toyoura001]|nr:zinc chelation protein SecC [Agarivorans sp. Toyoura001]